jgi:hypothetical protein
MIHKAPLIDSKYLFRRIPHTHEVGTLIRNYCVMDILKKTGRMFGAFSLLLLSALTAAQQSSAPPESPEEIVVTGRLPGPPLWRVSNGDNVLWIFAYLSPIPQDMQWESDRVEGMITRSQEYIGIPDADVSISPLVKFNPISIVRGMRLARRLSRNPDGQTLAEVLPPELYQRFSVLKEKYFPNDNDIERMRPLLAGQSMARLIQREEGLGSAEDIMRRIERMARRNRDMDKTEAEVDVRIEGGYGTLADRIEAMSESIAGAQEIACFEWQLSRMETDLEAMKSRANSWALGYIDEFRGIPLSRGEEDPCFNLLLTSSETGTIADVLAQRQQTWLDAAESALANNASTFAVLRINELIDDNGLLAQLKAKGYTVREPD